jgi:hypothetical protein
MTFYSRVWVSFRGPLDIELKGDGIIKHFVYGHPYTKEMMAAIMALLKELDDRLHHGTEGRRWRFFIGPKFLLIQRPTNFKCINSSSNYIHFSALTIFYRNYVV